MAVDVKYWIRKTPQPAALLCDDKRIEIPRNGRSWKDLAATIQSLEPSRLTALDAAGGVIRSVILEEEASAETTPATSAGMSDVQLFATLLERAYEKGSQSTKPIIEAAMAFVESLSQRLLKADGEIDRLRGVIHRQHMQISELTGAATSGGGEEGGILGAIVAGAMQAGGGNALAAVVGNGKAAAKK